MEDIIVTLDRNNAQEFIDLGVHKLEGSFIHACTSEQLDNVITKHFFNQDVYFFYLSKDIKNLRWEETLDGEIFPHIYGDITKEDVLKVQFLKKEEEKIWE